MAAPKEGAREVPGKAREPIPASPAAVELDFLELHDTVARYAVESEKRAFEAFKRGDVQLHAYYNALTNALGTVAGIFRGRKA